MTDLDPIEPEAAVDLYLSQRRDEISEQTHQSHRYRLEPFVEWCESEEIYNMNDLTGRDLHAFRVHRREEDGLKPVTLQGQLSTLRVFLKFCASIEAVPEGLHEKILLPSVSDDEEASDSLLEYNRAEAILDYLTRYHYASREHVILTLMWRTGLRTGSVRALDLQDFNAEKRYLDVVHRPGSGTPLKNGSRGERPVAISGPMVELLEAYIDGPRHDVDDRYGRDPLITTTQGRPVPSTIQNTVYRITRPCTYGVECPHDRDPDDCEAMESSKASRCPSSRSPHDVRSGAITAHLLDDVPKVVVSDRMNVSQDVLDRHYDQRTDLEQMEQRRKYISGR